MEQIDHLLDPWGVQESIRVGKERARLALELADVPDSPFYDPKQLQYAQTCAHFKALELRGKYGFSEEDIDDLKQEMLLRLWRQRRFFNPKRGKWSTFCNNVFSNHIRNIIAHRRAACRDYRMLVMVG